MFRTLIAALAATLVLAVPTAAGSPVATSPTFLSQTDCFESTPDHESWLDSVHKNAGDKPIPKALLQSLVPARAFSFARSAFDCRIVSYSSDGQIVLAYVIRPRMMDPSGKLPLLVYNRGGNGNYGKLDPLQVFMKLLPLGRPRMTQRVLILEDQPFQRGYLANLFGSRGGVQVNACEDVEAAIALCACHSYDLVVSDLLMPGQDGIQFIQALAAQPRPPRLAVASTASRRMMASARLMAESLGLEVLGVVSKPVAAADVEVLLEALAQARPSTDAAPAQAAVLPEPDARQLRQAMVDGSLTAWFQPKKSLQSGRVVAAEALVRWRHPQLGTLTAGSFLPAICRHGLEGELLRMMLEASIKAQARWRRQGFRVPVSINLPPHLLEQSDLPDELLAMTLALGGTPGELCFELMENSTTRHVSDFYAGACRLRMKGFGLAQDDFGQGLSSVHNLVNTPFTEVKIDRALVSGCARDPALHLTLATIIALANQLGLVIVAEGVESDADLAVLRQLGCSQVQGFLISQALPPEEFTCLLDDEAPRADEAAQAALR